MVTILPRIRRLTMLDVLNWAWGGPGFPSYEGRLGGGQANSGQASTAAAQQTAANNQDMAISAQNSATQQRMINTLFGNGSPGSSGTLTGMMNPASLTQNNFNPAYQAQWNQAQGQIAQNYALQRGQLAQGWANSGMSSNNTPSGFQADQQRQLASSEADARGSTYAGLKGQQYQDSLNNFWNSSNIASGNAATAGSTATQSAGNAGSSSAQIYGTAGQYHANPVASSLIGAGGQVGAAAAGKPPKPPGCWIAEAIYGVDDPRTLLLRHWLNFEFTKQNLGRIVMTVYISVGQQTAWAVRKSGILRAIFRPLFERALRKARAWEVQRAD